MARLGWAAVLVLAARTAGAAELRDMLAVLDLSVEDEAVTDAVALTVTDGLRSAARKAAGTQLKIMTRENMLEMLPPGTDQRCFKGACLATIGRQIQARFVMGGAIRKVGSRLSVTVEAYESTGGNLLGAEVPKTRNVDELIDLIDKEAPGWIRTWIPGLAGATVAVAPLASVPVVSAPPPPAVAAGGPSIRRSSSTKAASDLTITAKPSEGVRLDITDPAGKTLASGVPYKNPQAAPGRWKVTARAAGYEDETRDVDVPADDTILAKIDMKLLGALSVTGTPAGAQVVVTGPGLPGGRDEGGLPWEASGVSIGTYRVKVTRTGYRDYDVTVQVEPGCTAAVKVALQRVEAEPVRPQPGTSVPGSYVEPKSGLEFIRLAGGRFHYGCEPGDTECSNEKPGRDATVGAFWLGKTEVTVNAWARCVSAGACVATLTGGACNWGKSGRGSHPVNCVDSSETEAFCKWLGGRLPTTEEWEFAAKSGGGRIYPWGNERVSCRRAIMTDDGKSGCGKGSTWPVCSKPSGNSPAGICDLAGNVEELTASEYYPHGEEFRGGGWSDGPQTLRSSNSREYRPTGGNDYVGLRCALSR